MNQKTFFITLGLVLALVAISLSPIRHSGIPPAADDNYYYAWQAVTAKCGQNAQLLGIFMVKGSTNYAFTHGTCGTGSANEYVEVDYDSKARFVEVPKMDNFGSINDFDFIDHQNTQPISLSYWEISSGEAFRIISAHGGPPNLNALTARLALRQVDGSLVWYGTYSKDSHDYGININATTGQVIRNESLPVYLP